MPRGSSFILLLTIVMFAAPAHAQQNLSVPILPRGMALANQQQPIAQNAQDRASRRARRFGVGVAGGVGLDPEIIDVGAHVTFGPVFKPDLIFRPGVEIGVGEITTTFAINLDFAYSFRGSRDNNDWIPYIGTGPTFGLSHRGFSTDETDHVSTPNGSANRFDFSDTDFNGGMNFIVGMRKARGVFFEMKATAWGVSNIRLLAGFNF